MQQAKWKDIVWQVSSEEIQTIQELSFSWEQQAENNSSTEDISPTNEKGMKLFQPSFKTVLHAGGGIDVRQRIEQFRALVSETDYLYINNTPLGPKIQLRKIAVSGVRMDNMGRWIYAEVQFSFTENVDESDADPDISANGTSAQSIGPSPADKVAMAPVNTEINNAPVTSPASGSYVYADSQSDRVQKILSIDGKNVFLSDGSVSDTSKISMA